MTRIVIPPEHVSCNGMQAVRDWLEWKEVEYWGALSGECFIRQVMDHRNREFAARSSTAEHRTFNSVVEGSKPSVPSNS